MFSIIETVATAILLLLIMMLVLHLIYGDAGEWILNKFKVDNGVITKNVRKLPPAQPGGSTTGFNA